VRADRASGSVEHFGAGLHEVVIDRLEAKLEPFPTLRGHLTGMIFAAGEERAAP
jgi:hypothetical protein